MAVSGGGGGGGGGGRDSHWKKTVGKFEFKSLSSPTWAWLEAFLPLKNTTKTKITRFCKYFIDS